MFFVTMTAAMREYKLTRQEMRSINHVPCHTGHYAKRQNRVWKRLYFIKDLKAAAEKKEKEQADK